MRGVLAGRGPVPTCAGAVIVFEPGIDMPTFSRRRFLAISAPWALAIAGLGALPARAALGKGRFGPPHPFNLDRLKGQAQALAAKPYVASPPPVPKLIESIDFDVVQKIKFRSDRELWPNGAGPFPVRLFPLDRFNALPVRIYGIEDGVARQLIYSPDDFDFGNTDLAARLPADVGYSGFRVMNGPEAATDWLAFQGASYFRSAGAENQYGASARGVAVNTALSTTEEFPRFVAFWLAEPDRSGRITIYALLDGPSLTGAYRFDATKETGAIIDVSADSVLPHRTLPAWASRPDQHVLVRREQPAPATDWRPEIHDSDGLALWTGTGERIWRPLINPHVVQTNSFADVNPRGFGLMQRDRAFDDYQDDGAFYNRRPASGSSRKAIGARARCNSSRSPPTTRSTTTSSPTGTRRARSRQAEPCRSPTGCTGATTIRFRRQASAGGRHAHRARRHSRRSDARDREKWKFVVDFEGGVLTDMAARFDVTPVVVVSRGGSTTPMSSRWSAPNGGGRFRCTHRGPGPCEFAPVPPAWDQDPHRNLALPVLPAPLTAGLLSHS